MGGIQSPTRMTRSKTSNGSKRSEPLAAPGETHRQKFILPARSGAAPKVTDGIPHVQLDQTADDELLETMSEWVFSLPGIVEKPSRTSLPGARALTLAPDASTARSEAMMIGREFAHIHPQPYGGSMHMKLPESKIAEVVGKGWGEKHPLALDGSVPNLLMVYAPRNDEDLAAVKLIISAAVEYATSGRTTS